jgi:acyl-CoA thioesterase-2
MAKRSPLDGLLALHELQPLDRDIFLAETPQGEGRLFGGLVAAQAVRAASLTVERGDLHSLHAYFLRPGAHGVPIRFVVHRIRDGRTFTTRRVVAHQAGEAILGLESSFARPEPSGISHQDPAPEAPEPELVPDWERLRAEMLRQPGAVRPQPVEVRTCDPDDPEGKPQPPEKRVWMRPVGPLPEDRRIHEALLVYASDRTLLSTASRPHGLPWGKRMVASLDHAMWLHRPARFDDWVLYAARSPVAAAARGLVFGGMYDRAGTRIASVAQEGLIRIPRQ